MARRCLLPWASRFRGANTTFNTLYASLVAELTTTASPIALADTQFSGWNPRAMTWDGTHPRPAGESRIAQRFAWALIRPGFRVVTQPPRIVSERGWFPKPVPGITTTRGHRLTYDWTEDATRLRILDVQVWRRKLGGPWVHSN